MHAEFTAAATAVDARHLGNRIPDSPDFPIFLPGIGEGIPDSRFGRETGNPRIPKVPGVLEKTGGDFPIPDSGVTSINCTASGSGLGIHPAASFML